MSKSLEDFCPTPCALCGEWFDLDTLVRHPDHDNDGLICTDCNGDLEANREDCRECGDRYDKSEMRNLFGSWYCLSCRPMMPRKG